MGFIQRLKILANLALARPFTADSFDVVYSMRKDPWNYQSEYEQEKYRKTLSLLPEGEIKSGLEIGCAEGVFTRMLAPRVGELLGIDVSPIAVERAQESTRNFSNVRFRCMNLETDPNPGKFDLLLASEVLYYLRTPERIRCVARRMLEWLNPGGSIVLCHMRRKSDEAQGFSVPWWSPPHPGSKTVHGVFDTLPELSRTEEIVEPLYRVARYQLR